MAPVRPKGIPSSGPNGACFSSGHARLFFGAVRDERLRALSAG